MAQQLRILAVSPEKQGSDPNKYISKFTQSTSPVAENANLNTHSTVTPKHTPTFSFLFERKKFT